MQALVESYQKVGGQTGDGGADCPISKVNFKFV